MAHFPEQSTFRIVSYFSSLLLSLFLLFIFIPPLMAQEVFQLLPYFPKRTFTGYTRPVQEMYVTSEVSGICRKVFVEKGDKLSEERLIAAIDTTFIDLKIEANLLAQRRIGRTIQQLQKDSQRYSTLLEKKSTPQATYDGVSLQLDLNILQLQELKVEEKRLFELKSRHTFKGPKGWLVIDRFKEQGEYIHTRDSIAHLGDFRHLIIPLALTFQEYTSIKNIDSHHVFLPDLGLTVDAKLHIVSPDFNEKSRKIDIDLIIQGASSNPPVKIRGGLRAQVQISSQMQPNTYLVPPSSIMSSYEAHWLKTPKEKRVKVIYLGQTKDSKYGIVSLTTQESGKTFLVNP